MSREALENLAVYQKAKEILSTTRALVETFEHKHPRESKDFLIANCTLLSSKIVGAEEIQDYGLKMENALLIRIAARELKAHTASLMLKNATAQEYIKILRSEIDEFRILLKDWIETFDPSQSHEWEWSIHVKGSFI